MLRLRPYKSVDAKTIVKWCHNEETFRQWCSDRYDDFPITAADMNDKYLDKNGDCIEMDNFYPMTAYDDNGIVGHLIIRYINGDYQNLRFGWVIIDETKRGMGYGKQMLKLAQKYAFEFLDANKISIGVFDSNMQAYYCYTSAGFKDVDTNKVECYEFNGKRWNVLELEMKKSDYELEQNRSTRRIK